LLSPLGPNGDRKYCTASFDLDADESVTQEFIEAVADAILIVDGTFLQCPELREEWDVAIFVRTSERVSEERGLRRDADRLGGEIAARELYGQRYRPAYTIYQKLSDPE
jgi:uridine kinase